MNYETGKAPVICEECETVFLGGVNAYICPACRKKRASENAKRRGLSALGRAAQRKKKEGESK
jgi:hypothetical protein